MNKENFIEQLLERPPSELVEDVGASSHETRRIPDPRILIVKDGELFRLDWKRADDSIEKESSLGQVEYTAFAKIKEWANKNDEGIATWFSPPYPAKYPFSKIDLNEICYLPDGQKILLKRAIVINIDSRTLFSIANNFLAQIGGENVEHPEFLRSKPLFFKSDQFFLLLKEISVYEDRQVELIEDGKDLEIKTETYSQLTEIETETSSIAFYTYDSRYFYTRQVAEERGLIGEYEESCSGASKTAFEVLSESSNTETIRILRCACPNCGKTVDALIFAGHIYCPSCGASATYVC
jgi:hypothetical protein